MQVANGSEDVQVRASGPEAKLGSRTTDCTTAVWGQKHESRSVPLFPRPSTSVSTGHRNCRPMKVRCVKGEEQVTDARQT